MPFLIAGVPVPAGGGGPQGGASPPAGHLVEAPVLGGGTGVSGKQCPISSGYAQPIAHIVIVIGQWRSQDSSSQVHPPGGTVTGGAHYCCPKHACSIGWSGF